MQSLKNGFFYGRPAIEPPGIPILRISAVRPMSVNLDEPRFVPGIDEDMVKGYFLEKGDLLFTRYNGNAELVGACGRVKELPKPTIYPDKLIRVKVNHDIVLPEYLEMYFATQTARKFIEGRIKSTAGQHGIAGGDIKSIPVILPPLEEQAEIVRRVESLFAYAERLEARYLSASERVERLTPSLLAKAFRGELVEQEQG
jgi:type I restriction enzyme S subunit